MKEIVEKMPSIMIERPKMPRATWEALRAHIVRERLKKKQEQEQNQEVRKVNFRKWLNKWNIQLNVACPCFFNLKNICIDNFEIKLLKNGNNCCIFDSQSCWIGYVNQPLKSKCRNSQVHVNFLFAWGSWCVVCAKSFIILQTTNLCILMQNSVLVCKSELTYELRIIDLRNFIANST